MTYAIAIAILLFLILFAPRFTLFITVVAILLTGGAAVEASLGSVIAGTILAFVMMMIFPRATAVVVLAALSVIVVPIWLFLIIVVLMFAVDVILIAG